MRYHHLRFDIWFCLLLAFLVSFIPVKITEQILPKKYEEYVKDHTVEEGEIGGVALDSVVRVESIEEMLQTETFTVISPGIEYRNKGAGYYENSYMHALTLPSGEKVAAVINEESVRHLGDSIYSGDSILPVGRVVYEDLTKNSTFLNQIEFKEPLSRTDFYVDMRGNGGIMSEENYSEAPKAIVQLVTIVIAFPIFHACGSKIGIFPYFFAPKKKQESEWD